MPKVLVELDTEFSPIRIFRNKKRALSSDPKFVKEMEKKEAVTLIRLQVIARAIRKGLILCEFCGNVVTAETGHMHEILARGDGGEISLDNSRFICPECHIGKTGEHGDRYWNGRKDN